VDIERVTIKSYPNGISLFLDKKVKFEELLLEIGRKFNKGADFFKDATLVLSIEGRILSIEEERLVLQTIEKNSRLCICSIAGKDESIELLFENRIKKLRKISNFNQVEIKENKIIRNSLTDMQSIESDTTVIILGNVEKGSSVTSEKDILILGTLYGEARAGVDKKKDHFIFASVMEPESITIGDENFDLNKKFIKKNKKTAQIAYIENKKIVITQVEKVLFEESI
jgi:septum site-determining protein MinC